MPETPPPTVSIDGYDAALLAALAHYRERFGAEPVRFRVVERDHFDPAKRLNITEAPTLAAARAAAVAALGGYMNRGDRLVACEYRPGNTCVEVAVDTADGGGLLDFFATVHLLVPAKTPAPSAA